MAVSRSRPPALIPLFAESLVLLGRYSVIMYPIFGYFILSSLFLPHGKPDLSSWPWWVVMVGLVAIMFLFRAGWNVMMRDAITEWETMRAEHGSIAARLSTIPFALLGKFLPGLGEYGPSFLLGGLLWFLITVGPTLLIGALAYAWLDVPASLLKFLSNPDWTAKELNAYLAKLPQAELMQVNLWSLLLLLGGFLCLVTNFLTFYWQQFLVLQPINSFQAHWRSMRHAVKHPVATLLLFVSYGVFYVFCILLSSASTLAAFFGNFLLILTMVYFGLLMFLYLIRFEATQAAPAILPDMSPADDLRA